VRITVDLPDDVAAECERRAPDTTWQRLITDALVFALTQAGAEQPDSEAPEDETA
jgi:hypothetical protein